VSRATPVLAASLALELEVAGTVSSASTGVVAVGPPKVKRAELPRNRNSDGRTRPTGRRGACPEAETETERERWPLAAVL